MPQVKKPSKKQLEKKIEKLGSAIIHIPQDDSYKSVYFEDMGVKLEITKEWAIYSRNFCVTSYTSTVSSGFSQPYQLISFIINLSEKYKCNRFEDLKKLATNEEELEIIYVRCFEMWAYSLLQPQFECGLTSVGMSNLFLMYSSFLSRTNVIFDIKNDMTKAELFNEYIKKMRLLSLDYGNDIDLSEKILKLEDDCFNEIKNEITLSGGTLSEHILLFKPKEDSGDISMEELGELF